MMIVKPPSIYLCLHHHHHQNTYESSEFHVLLLIDRSFRMQTADVNNGDALAGL